MSDTTYNVLFLCTGNSARSIMAEAILNADASGKFRAFSAGSHPKGEIDPTVLALLKKTNYPTQGLRSKSWGEFAGPEAPRMDFVFTVCDNAAGEVCPIWPGHPSKVHLGFPDPAAAEGSHQERLAVFSQVYDMIEARMSRLVELGPDRAGEA
ncbi:MAG: arsenate reductase ArsC [Magnetospirillum gryphiswaldense]|nr:arsenate reductase ArsC [Magnetospirillum gryphiswaldense]